MDDQTELKKRLINHLDDLREFARLPEAERDEIMDGVCDYVRDELSADGHKFFIGLEYFLRLQAVSDAPALYAETIERDSPDEQKPQRHFETFIASRFADNETGETIENPKLIVAESAVFINFGGGTKLDDRSLMIVADREKNGYAIEFQFDIGGQIAVRGTDSIHHGRDRSAAGFEQFENVIKKYFYFNSPAEITDLYDHGNFRFFAFGSTRDLTNALDRLTLSDDIIETN